MEIRISGKFERSNRSIYTQKEIDKLFWIGDGFVFVQYIPEDIFLGDVFILEDGTEIKLLEIKLQFDTKEPLEMMGHGWKCLCRFENLDLKSVRSVRDWFSGEPVILANRKNSQE